MKKLQLLGLLMASSLTLSGCGETRTPDSGKNVTSFPSASIASFLKDEGVTDGTTVPSFKANSYTFSVKKDESRNFNWFEMYAYTNTESAFDDYINKVKGESWTVLDGEGGAIATKGQVGMELNKYFKDGKFKSVDFRIYSLVDGGDDSSSGSSSGSGSSSSGSGSSSSGSGGGGGGGGDTYKDLPISALTSFISDNGILTSASDILLPQSTKVWSSEAYEDEEGPCFYAETASNIVSNYRTALNSESGWNCETKTSDGSTYYEVSYDKDDSFGIQFYWGVNENNVNVFQWYFYPTGEGGGSSDVEYQTSTTWPSEAITAFGNAQKVVTSLPEVSGSLYEYASYDNGGMTFELKVHGNTTTASSYASTLTTSDGWTAVSATDSISGTEFTYYTKGDNSALQVYDDEDKEGSVLCIYLYPSDGGTTSSDEEWKTSTSWPTSDVNTFCNSYNTSNNIPAYPTGNQFVYGEFDDEGMFMQIYVYGGNTTAAQYAALFSSSWTDVTSETGVSDGSTIMAHSDENSYVMFIETTDKSGNPTFLIQISPIDDGTGGGGGGGGDVTGVEITINNVSGVDSGISWTSAQNGGSSAPAENSGNLRLYQGNSITFTTSGTITDVVLTFTFNKKKSTTFPIEPDVSSGSVGTIDNENATTLTVSGVNASTLTITLPMFGGGNVQLVSAVFGE